MSKAITLTKARMKAASGRTVEALDRGGRGKRARGARARASRERERGTYLWRAHLTRYERVGSRDAETHVVFIHGFGVGKFHFASQLSALGGGGTCAWALDLCGQGESWPVDDDAVEELHAQKFRYSVDTWRDQVEEFLRDVVGKKSYVCGNSLGGYLATYVSATSPELVRGLVLMNATPFWAFVPNDESSIGYRLAPWRGALPVPKWVSTPFRAYWDSFRSEANVKGLLGLVYANKARIDNELIERIIAPTNNPNALFTFCSVVWSPKSSMSFDDMLAKLRDDESIPIALVYGRDDPWVVPLWGQRLKRAIPRAEYYEISPGGHCPAHECPETTNALISDWIEYCESGRIGAPPFGTPDGAGTLIQGEPRNIFEKIDAFRASTS